MADQPKPRASNQPLHKTLAGTASLANLLPTGTVLAFHALTPSFSDHGSCQMWNQYLTISLIVFCAAICFFSSFTDSFVDGNNFYYCIATFRGLYIFNYDNREGEERKNKEELAKFKIRFIDFVHAFVSLMVFLVLASSNSEVQSCLFPTSRANQNALIINLPLGAGVLSSFLFILFPTNRKGIEYAETVAPGSTNIPPGLA